jgi:hypothetical protein
MPLLEPKSSPGETRSRAGVSHVDAVSPHGSYSGSARHGIVVWRLFVGPAKPQRHVLVEMVKHCFNPEAPT